MDGQGGGDSFMWVGQTVGRDAVRPEDMRTRGRATPRWVLLAVLAVAALALLIPLVL